jgi:hypothetical protein
MFLSLGSPPGSGPKAGPDPAGASQEKRPTIVSWTDWIDPAIAAKVVTMASVMTPRTTAYSAIV